jgi:hypothetical protein
MKADVRRVVEGGKKTYAGSLAEDMYRRPGPVLGRTAAGAARQEIYERAFELPHRRMIDIPRRLLAVAGLAGTNAQLARARAAIDR